MSTLIIISALCIIAGGIFAAVIILCNKDKVTGRTPWGWWIPAIGFFLLYSAVLPWYFYVHDPANPSFTAQILEWCMWGLLGISCVAWGFGKIVTKK